MKGSGRPPPSGWRAWPPVPEPAMPTNPAAAGFLQRITDDRRRRIEELKQRLPLLLKDFVIDSYQIVDAAVRGADGVLLLASVLSDVQLQRLITEARLLGLDCLVEVHDADELTTSLRAGATLLGLNNRDLRT